MMRFPTSLALTGALSSILLPSIGLAQDIPVLFPRGVQTSPFDAPEPSDLVFSVDSAPGLDTGCTFSSGSPLQFSIEIDRYIGDVDSLQANGLLPDRVRLQMPAFDVDFSSGERDEVFINGNRVSERYLTGTDGTWKLNTFEIPISWLNLPSDPGPGGILVPTSNDVEIHIDVDIPGDNWCTAIDWASISFEQIPLPALFVHGILSNGSTWSGGGGPLNWGYELTQLGIPNSGTGNLGVGGADPLNLGNLDAINDNASEIEVRIQELKARWGVDQVNLVCHSKGGIDSRAVAATSDSIACLIQLGTPNLGAPLADMAQKGLINACINSGPLTCLALQAVNIFGVPAGYQLSTYYMQNHFNPNTPVNGNVSYRALAGQYEVPAGCSTIECSVETALASITGPGDLIVPTTSVVGLPSISSFPVLLGVGDRQVRHSGLPLLTSLGLTGSQRAYGVIAPSLLTCGSTSGTAPLGVPTATIASISKGGVLAAGASEGQSFQVSIGQPEAIFVLQYQGGLMDLTLTSPDGSSYSLATPAGTDGVFASAFELLGGQWVTMRVENPLPGQWDAQVTATNIVEPGGNSIYVLAASQPSELIDFSVEVLEEVIRVGLPITLQAELAQSGAGITGGAVEVSFVLPDMTVDTVMLNDDGLGADPTAGDGLYSASYGPLTQGGSYRALAEAQAAHPVSGGAFERQALFGFAATQNTSRLTGVYADSGVDINGDGLFEYLDIEVGLDIQAAGDYRVFAVLTDDSGNQQQVAVDETLSIGMSTQTLRFDGEAIYQAGIDGPYHLARVRLNEIDPVEFMTVDGDLDAFDTLAYVFDSFQHEGLSLSGVSSDLGVDTDADGDFDFLDVELGLNLAKGGTYAWSARLVDAQSREIDFAGGQGFLSAPNDTIQLRFDGALIGASGVDGPYYVRDLLINGANGATSIASVVHTTSPYLVSDFDGFSGWTTVCFGVSNSTGFPANLTLEGSTSVASNNMNFEVDNLPVGVFGLAIYGRSSTSYPFGSGVLCVSPFFTGLFRVLPVQMSNSSGQVNYPLDLTALPAGGEVIGGSTWYFQYIYRDVISTGPTFNMSSAIEIQFLP